ncbi:MAG: IPT/TIG domain-containing protein [Acidobacteria bacterium]|nr:IPT/TIG domain-containing protein [Acidobacteriota bacterium]
MPANSVVKAASFRPTTQPNSAITPGAIVSIFGTNLASGSQSASAIPLPAALLDMTVTFNGIPAPLFYVSDGQITTLVPFELPPGTASVQIKRGSNSSTVQTVAVATVSPEYLRSTSRDQHKGPS